MNSNNKFYSMSRAQQIETIKRDIFDIRDKVEHLEMETKYNGCQNDAVVAISTEATMSILERMELELSSLHKNYVLLKLAMKESDAAIKAWHEKNSVSYE